MSKTVPTAPALVPLPLLAEPQSYVACVWDLRKDAGHCAYWLRLFREHFPSLLEAAVAEAVERGIPEKEMRERAEQARVELDFYVDEVARGEKHAERLYILDLCYRREEILRGVGIVDPFRLTKERENRLALANLPAVLTELDGLADPQRCTRVVEGMFAGNIFDLGATQTQHLFKNQTVDFTATRAGLKKRPWRVDDLDRWVAKLTGKDRPRRAVVFVDNAGADVVLGMAPFCRDLVQRGVEVIMTANATPTLNDVTHEELMELMGAIGRLDRVTQAAMEKGQWRLISSGNGVPLIDLKRVSAELVAAIQEKPVDLLVLEGMGRGIESNFNAKFTCDALKVAMIKDRGVAESLGGELFDLVLRFDQRK